MTREQIVNDSDREMNVLGVPGRLTHRTIKPGQAPGLWFKQRWISEWRNVQGYGRGARMKVELEFDDEHGNGHNTFTITAEVRIPGRPDIEAGGCMHEEIARYFPELAPLVKWHLVSSDGPMHYVANTVYLAGDRDHWGRKAGEPSSFEYGVRFDAVPVTHRISKSLWDFLKQTRGGDPYHIEEVPYPEKQSVSGFKFGPQYTLNGFVAKWHGCPFDDLTKAQEFCLALNVCTKEYVTIPTAWSEGKARELDAARRAAVWPEATDEQLSVEREELKAALEARLPKLLEEFRSVIESIGFWWTSGIQ